MFKKFLFFFGTGALRMKSPKALLAVTLLVSALFIYASQAQAYFVRGDANCDGSVDSLDIAYLADFLFSSGPPPPCRDAGDVNDNGAIGSPDIIVLADFLYGGGPPPAMPYPLCGTDPTTDALDCLSECCPSHFKGYSMIPKPFSTSVFTDDQFMQDNLFLTGPILLANPVQKDTFPVTDIRDHLHWYSAEGRDTLIYLSYKNQFESTGVFIDSVKWLLVPTLKQPHAFPESLSHYKCYRIQESVWLSRQPFMQDQFGTEGADSLRRDLFCTPCQKDTFLPFDTLTHYVGYLIAPGQPMPFFPFTVQTQDQFNTWLDTILGSKYLLVPTAKYLPPPPPPDTGKNHYKVWLTNPQPIDTTVQVQDQFMFDNIHLDSISFLANPVTKIVGTDTSNIIDPDDHLTWYLAQGRDTLLAVEYKNQFESTTVVIDSVKWVLVPTTKQPHPPYDSLDHYKCYYIRNPQWMNRPHLLQDQFDVPNFEQIDSLLPVYFCAPCSKDGSQQFDTLTHYVAYYFAQPPRSVPSRITEDQFGMHSLNFNGPWGILVPTEKLSFGAPSECSDGQDNDGDGLVDFPADCGCTDPNDNSEAPNPVRACNNGIDDDLDGFIDGYDLGCSDVCDDDEFNPLPDTGKNHYKTWQIEPLTISPETVTVQDQFMEDTLILVSLNRFSNPVRKIVSGDTFQVVRPDNHLSWYSLLGARDSALTVGYVNQFESTEVTMQVVDYFVVPAQKLPHAPYDSLDHYKAYRFQDALGRKIVRTVLLQDQFDQTPIQIDSLFPVWFFTPAQKNNEPMYDTVTHYVAYYISPEPPIATLNRDIIDQFGPHQIQTIFGEMLMVPTRKLCIAQPGDVNGTPPISLPDVIHLVNYVFDKDRPATGCLGSSPGNCWTPDPLCRGEVNGTPPISLPDIIYLVNYVFDKDRPATSCLGSSPGNCWCPVPTETCCLSVLGCP